MWKRTNKQTKPKRTATVSNEESERNSLDRSRGERMCSYFVCCVSCYGSDGNIWIFLFLDSLLPVLNALAVEHNVFVLRGFKMRAYSMRMCLCVWLLCLFMDVLGQIRYHSIWNICWTLRVYHFRRHKHETTNSQGSRKVCAQVSIWSIWENRKWKT